MIKEIETEKGSIVLDSDLEDCVDYLAEIESVEKRIKDFEPPIRGQVRKIIHDVIRGIVGDYDLDGIVEEDDAFWEWMEAQQED